MPAAIGDWKFWALVAAAAFVALALVLPRVTLDRDAYDVVAIIDITGSMNTRDMKDGSHPESRLSGRQGRGQRLTRRLAVPVASRPGHFHGAAHICVVQPVGGVPQPRRRR